ncbi:MAG: SpoIIE family protein phosphatase [Firmicutes bacterium]|nr:SpoIIE family protein phosphatase [Bacillota bacterium]
MDVYGKMFGIERMLDVINRYKDSDSEKILSSVRDAVDEYAGEADQFDDLTMLCFEYFGKAE